MARVKVKVTAHAVTRFKERIFAGGSAGYIQEMVRNAVEKGYEILDRHLTFGIVTFVLEPHRGGWLVITCYKAQQIALPALAEPSSGV